MNKNELNKMNSHTCLASSSSDPSSRMTEIRISLSRGFLTRYVNMAQRSAFLNLLNRYATHRAFEMNFQRVSFTLVQKEQQWVWTRRRNAPVIIQKV